MADVNEVANFFIKYFSEKGKENDLTNMKLNKLLYFAYGIYLARTGKELFKCNFKKYPYGPVEEIVYNVYKDYTNDVIRTSNFPNLNEFDFEEDQEEALIDVLSEYGGKSAWVLSELTHEGGTPWSETSDIKGIITKEKIKKYFEKNSPKTINEIIENTGTYGRHDENRMLILPADDDWREDD